MRTLTICLMTAALLGLAGCAKTPPPETPAAAPAAAAQPTPPADNTQMRDAIQQPMDKARAVEDATQKAAEDQRKQIEAAGG